MLALHKENTYFPNNKCQGMPPTNMLEYLIIHKSFVIDVYMEDMANMKFQIHHLHLEQYFIQKERNKNGRHLILALLCLYLSWYIFVGSGKFPTSNII